MCYLKPWITIVLTNYVIHRAINAEEVEAINAEEDGYLHSKPLWSTLLRLPLDRRSTAWGTLAGCSSSPRVTRQGLTIDLRMQRATTICRKLVTVSVVGSLFALTGTLTGLSVC